MSSLKVQKKDGVIEDFDRNKIVNGIVKSSGTPEQAENIAGQIEAWANAAAVDGTIKAIDIKTKLLELLGAVNPVAKANFENYQKPTV